MDPGALAVFAAAALGTALGSAILLRAAARPGKPGPDEGERTGPTPRRHHVTFEADGEGEAGHARCDDAAPAFADDEADWDAFLPPIPRRVPPLARARAAPRPPPEPLPEVEGDELDIGALAARLAAEGARPDLASRDLPRIDGFDAAADDIEIPVEGDAPGEVSVAPEEDGLVILVDGRAVARVGGVGAIAPERIRLVAA